MVLSMAAAQGEPVTQAHTDKCARDGHAHWTRDGRDVGVCARCGDVTEAVGPRKDEGAGIMGIFTGWDVTAVAADGSVHALVAVQDGVSQEAARLRASSAVRSGQYVSAAVHQWDGLSMVGTEAFTR
jgi:hypothetical protein